jgi:hypothetical protein
MGSVGADPLARADVRVRGCLVGRNSGITALPGCYWTVRTNPVVFSAGHHRHSVALAVAAVTCAAALGACGGGGSGAGKSRDFGQALKFSQCMRAHGLTNFPDPSTRGGGIQIGGPGSGIDPRSPVFQAAQKACARYAPFKGGPPRMTAAQARAAVRFAECVRSHGYPDFPDPALSPPKGSVAVLALRGMVFAFKTPFDPQTPAFRHAAAHCGLQLPPAGAGRVRSAP